MKVQIVNKSDFELPAYATEGSAGMDLRADLKRYMLEHNIGVIDGDDEPTEIATPVMALTMRPFQQYIIPTGIFVALPENRMEHTNMTMQSQYFGTQDTMVGYELQIRPRSGLAAKHGITVLNTPGTIDSDYRGEIKVILICLNAAGYTITHGERIAQMVLDKYAKMEFVEAETLDETQRGTGGFGHTGA